MHADTRNLFVPLVIVRYRQLYSVQSAHVFICQYRIISSQLFSEFQYQDSCQIENIKEHFDSKTYMDMEVENQENKESRKRI